MLDKEGMKSKAGRGQNCAFIFLPNPATGTVFATLSALGIATFSNQQAINTRTLDATERCRNIIFTYGGKFSRQLDTGGLLPEAQVGDWPESHA